MGEVWFSRAMSITGVWRDTPLKPFLEQLHRLGAGMPIFLQNTASFSSSAWPKGGSWAGLVTQESLR